MGNIKLRPKQLATLTEIATKKQQLNNIFQDLNKQELLIVELVLEEANVTEQVTNVKIEGETLSFDLVEVKKAAPKGKSKKMEPVLDK